MAPFWVIAAIVVGVGVGVYTFIMSGRFKQPGREFEDIKDPTAGENQPVRLIVGRSRVKMNQLSYHEKSTTIRKVRL